MNTGEQSAGAEPPPRDPRHRGDHHQGGAHHGARQGRPHRRSQGDQHLRGPPRDAHSHRGAPGKRGERPHLKGSNKNRVERLQGAEAGRDPAMLPMPLLRAPCQTLHGPRQDRPVLQLRRERSHRQTVQKLAALRTVRSYEGPRSQPPDRIRSMPGVPPHAKRGKRAGGPHIAQCRINIFRST